MNTTVTPRHPALQPSKIGRFELTNRLVVAPMSRVSAAADGTPTDEMADYYAQFARGGFGLVITEGTYTDTTHSQGYLNQPGLATDATSTAGAGDRCGARHGHTDNRSAHARGRTLAGKLPRRECDRTVGDSADRADAGGVRRIRDAGPCPAR